MKTILQLLVITIVASTSVATAQSTIGQPIEMKGTFHIHVDDAAKVYVNGVMIHEAGLGLSTSQAVPLKEGDHIVFFLRNGGGSKSFAACFRSEDGKQVDFKRTTLKVMPNYEATDFEPADLGKWKLAERVDPKKEAFPAFKSQSDWVWGSDEGGRTTLATVVTKDMIKPGSK